MAGEAAQAERQQIRQYLGPKGKRTPELMEEVTRVLALEAARQKEIRPDVPPWKRVFETAEQFDRADVASRAAGAESLKAFCREAILAKADEILEKKRRVSYPKMKPLFRSQPAGPGRMGGERKALCGPRFRFSSTPRSRLRR